MINDVDGCLNFSCFVDKLSSGYLLTSLLSDLAQTAQFHQLSSSVRS